MALLTVTDLFVLAFGCLVLAGWMFLFVRGRSNDWMFEQLDDEDYPVKELYFIGYELIGMLPLRFKSKKTAACAKSWRSCTAKNTPTTTCGWSTPSRRPWR